MTQRPPPIRGKQPYFRRSAYVIVAGWVVGLGIASAQPAAPPPEAPRVRTIPMNQQPLPSRLRADDEVVIVEREFGLMLQMDPKIAPREAVENASNMARAIVVLEVNHSESRLVEDDRWIATFTTGTVVDVIRPVVGLPLTPRGTLTLMENVGELLIEGKTVRTGPPVLQPFVPGQRYLVTMTFNPETGTVYPTGRWVVNKDGILQDTVLGDKGTDWRQAMTGLSLTDAIDTLRSLERARKVR